MEIEVILSVAATVPALLTALYSFGRAFRRAKLEMKIRDLLDDTASHDRRFNEVVKDANSSFIDNSPAYTRDEVDRFRIVLEREVAGRVEQEESKLLGKILAKNDAQMRNYSERVAHSVAGRRTFWGVLSNRVIATFMRFM
jgi:hypothetical protein